MAFKHFENVTPSQLTFDTIARECKFLSYVLDFEQLELVKGFPLDGDWKNFELPNVGYRFLGGPMENVRFPGFYVVPGSPMLSIHRDGSVINSITGRMRKWQINNHTGYVFLTVLFKGLLLLLSQHRAKKLTFEPYGENIDQLQINHKNGNKRDNALENLEWCTAKENINHAYEANLNTKCTPVLVRDIRTGEIKRYRSYSECGNVLNMSHKTIERRIKDCVFSKVWSDGLQFKHETDTREWVIPTNVDHVIDLVSRQNGVGCKIVDCTLNDVIECETMTHASNIVGCSVATIRNRLVDKDTGIYEGYIILSLNDNIPNYNADDIYRSYKQITVLNLDTGHVTIGDSARMLSKYTGIDDRVIRRMTKTKDHTVYRHYKFCRGDNISLLEEAKKHKK